MEKLLVRIQQGNTQGNMSIIETYRANGNLTKAFNAYKLLDNQITIA